MSNHRKSVQEDRAGQAERPKRRTLPYSDVPTDESSQPDLSPDVPADERSQPRLKHASDIRTRVTPRDRPRITPVSQPNPTFGYRPTEPQLDEVEPTGGEGAEGDVESAAGSDVPPSSAHMRAAASRRPRDLPPLVQDTNYRFVANRPRNRDKGSKDA